MGHQFSLRNLLYWVLTAVLLVMGILGVYGLYGFVLFPIGVVLVVRRVLPRVPMAVGVVVVGVASAVLGWFYSWLFRADLRLPAEVVLTILLFAAGVAFAVIPARHRERNREQSSLSS